MDDPAITKGTANGAPIKEEPLLKDNGETYDSIRDTAMQSIEPMPALSGRDVRNLPPGAYHDDATRTNPVPAERTPLSILGRDLRMAHKVQVNSTLPRPRPHPQRQEHVDYPDHATSSKDLMVANPISESEEMDLPQAQEYDPEDCKTFDSATEKTQRVDSRKQFIYWAAGVCIVVVITLVLVFTIPGDTATTAPATIPPTSSPSLSVKDYILQLLPLDTQHSIAHVGSPQAQAYDWVLNDPSLTEYSDDRVKQRFALATLYFATNGIDWTNSTDWLSYDVHECDWYNRHIFAMKDTFVHVYPGYLDEYDHENQPPRCNERGIYEHLWLDHNDLKGPIPEELYLLTALHTLSTGINHQLEGTISTQVGRMTNLEGMAVNFLGNAGTIPSEIGLLTDMRILILIDNGHEGSIPSELWRLSKLESLIMSRNHGLSGTIPTEVGLFPKLRWFTFDECSLSGTIPTEMGQIESLEWLVAPANRLHGTLPTELALLPNVLLTSLFGNQLEGTLPTELGLMTSNVLLSLHGNLFSGTIPSEYGLLTNLALGLGLENNPFLTGTIPTELGLLTGVYELALTNNNHVGPIPSEFGSLTSLGRLGLGNNSLTGTVPKELAALQDSLYLLDLQGNRLLSGTVPESLCAINATCLPNGLIPCDGKGQGLVFDCTEKLCGCDCSCGNDDDSILGEITNGTMLVIIPQH